MILEFNGEHGGKFWLRVMIRDIMPTKLMFDICINPVWNLVGDVGRY